MKILVIALAGIGDALLATPLIHELRANYPDAQIDALVLWAGSKDLLEGNPHLNTVYQRNLIKSSRSESVRFLRSLAPQRYDLSINTHPQSRIHYRLAARLVGARKRISHRYENFGLLDSLMVNCTLPQDYGRHTVDNNLDILALLGKKPLLTKHELEVFLTAGEHQWAESFIAQKGLQVKLRLGVHVGSGGTKNLTLKRWPLGHYIDLLKKVSERWPDLAILLFGGPEEQPYLDQILISVKSPLVMRAESRTLREAGALMQRCSAFLSVDTALMHLAAAVKTPHQIVIEAPTFNKTNEPYGNSFELVRNPAIGGRNLDYYKYDGRGIQGTREELLRCMASISVGSVLETLARALEGTDAG